VTTLQLLVAGRWWLQQRLAKLVASVARRIDQPTNSRLSSGVFLPVRTAKSGLLTRILGYGSRHNAK
jgi:hypothetical protein